MEKNTTKRCIKCLIQEDLDRNIVIDDNQICSLCKGRLEKQINWKEREKYFEDLINKYRKKNSKYDGMVMMSGGKDSIYLAYTLKTKYKLSLIGIINDMHYEYDETFFKTKKYCENLGIPLIINDLGKENMKEFFNFLFSSPELKEKGCGQVCNFCGRMMIRMAAEEAQKRDIPMLFSGHNPEQIREMGQSYETEKRMILRKNILNGILEKNITNARNALNKLGKKDLLKLFPQELFPKEVCGVFMYQFFPYEPEKMMRVIREQLNWEPINKISGTYIVSGCRLANLWMKVAELNGVANYVDYEFSSQIRNGVLNKKLVEKFYEDKKDSSLEVALLLKELGLNMENIL